MNLFKLRLVCCLTAFVLLSCSSTTEVEMEAEPQSEEMETPTDGQNDTDSETPDDTDNPDNQDTPDTDGEEPGPVNSSVGVNGQLRIQNGTLVNKDGDALQLRGMSFFWSQWIGKYYTAETVNWLKEDWQCNIVRAAMAVDADQGYLTNPDTEKQKVFTVIDAAIENGIYVIVDWHSHHAENFVDDAISFFSEVAQRYGDSPNVIYETYNEPVDVQWGSVLKPYHEQVIAAIRQHDPDNLIICGTRMYSQRVDEVIGNTIDDPNVAYTLHYYSGTHRQELRAIAQTALNNNIPLFVTEFGISEASGDGSIDIEEAERWWDFLDQNNISWCNWSIADKQELSAALRPNASETGGWPLSELTLSGTTIREEIRAKNPSY